MTAAKALKSLRCLVGPGDEVDDNIDVVEVRWDQVDICPAGRPDSIGKLFEESIETSMVEIELILEGFCCHFVKLLTLPGSVVDNVGMIG